MPTLARKTVLWAGPHDGLEVEVEDGTYQYFIPGPPKNWTPDAVIAAPEMWRGRYQWNSATKRFEWRGYE